VGKDLPPVGDISVSGIVAFGGFAPYMVLQNTSLGLVYKMAEITSNAIKYVLYKQQLEPQRNSKLSAFAAV